MAIITINTHYCSKEEKEELIEYLDEQSWDFKIEGDNEEKEEC